MSAPPPDSTPSNKEPFLFPHHREEPQNQLTYRPPFTTWTPLLTSPTNSPTITFHGPLWRDANGNPEPAYLDCETEMLKAHDTFRSPHIRVKEVYPLVWEDLQAVKAWKKTHVVTKREEELDGKGKMKAGEFKFFFESGKGDGASDSEPDEHEKKHSDLLLLRSQLAALKVGGRFPPTAPFPVQSNQLAQTTTSTQPPEEKPLLEADAERKMLEENGVLPHSSEATRLKARQWFEYGCYPEKHGFPPKLDDPARAAWDEQHRREHSVFVPVNKKVGGVEDEDSYDDLERGRERNKREEKVVEEKSERDEGEDAEVQRGRPRSKTVVAADIKEK